MKIWRLKYSLNEEYKAYQLKNLENPFYKDFCEKTKGGIELNGEFDNVEIDSVDGSKKSDLAHFWAGGNFILSNDNAKECLEDLIRESVEFIPLIYEKSTLYMINIISVIAATDHDKCIVRKSASGREVGYEKYVFIPEKVQGINIFKILFKGHIHSTMTFVSSEFKERVEQNHLTGFEFIEVWDSDSMKP